MGSHFIVHLVHVWQHKHCGSYLLAFVHMSLQCVHIWYSTNIVVHICRQFFTFHAWSSCTFQIKACKYEQKHKNVTKRQNCSHSQAKLLTFTTIWFTFHLPYGRVTPGGMAEREHLADRVAASPRLAGGPILVHTMSYRALQRWLIDVVLVPPRWWRMGRRQSGKWGRGADNKRRSGSMY